MLDLAAFRARFPEFAPVDSTLLQGKLDDAATVAGAYDGVPAVQDAPMPTMTPAASTSATPPTPAMRPPGPTAGVQGTAASR